MSINFGLSDRHGQNYSQQFGNRNQRLFFTSTHLSFLPLRISKLLLFTFLALFTLMIIAALLAGAFYFHKLSKTDQKGEENAREKITLQQNSSSIKELQLAFRRAYVRNMTASAFAAYRRCAWGQPELEPLICKGYFADGSGPLPGQTIVYAMSTFWVMDLKDEWAAGKEWIANHLRLDDVDAQLDMARLLIDYPGSLLSAYALSGDQVLLIKAIEVFNALPRTGLFDRSIGVFPTRFNPKRRAYNTSKYYFTVQVPELIYLYNLTRNADIGDWLATGRAEIRKKVGAHTFEKKTGFFERAQYAWREVASDYENMIYSYNQLGHWDTELLELFFEAVESVSAEGQFYSASDGQLYVNEFDSKERRFEQFMDDHDCRFGGMFALSSAAFRKVNLAKKATAHLDLAVRITSTCHRKAANTRTKMLPKKFTHTKTLDAGARVDSYLAHSYFHLYRLTGDEQYREWAWELAQAINRRCQTENGGFSSLKNSDSVPSEMIDYQPANLLSNTFKYLYLIFTDQSVLPADKWIFNQRGNPMPICGTNERYPKQMCER